MNKIINMLLMGIIGVLDLMFMVVIYVVGMIFLVFNEVPGTKKFMDKLKDLNQIVKEEFVSAFQIFHKLCKAKKH